MHHVAIMKKSWGLLPKILTKEKVIESRWSKNKSKPWGKVSSGDKVYFKNSGELVTIMANISKVLEIENLKPKKVRQILHEYSKRDGIGKKEIDKYYKLFKDKKYCVLVFLKNPRRITPFGINKKGFGAIAAWLTLNNINKIKLEKS